MLEEKCCIGIVLIVSSAALHLQLIEQQRAFGLGVRRDSYCGQIVNAFMLSNYTIRTKLIRVAFHNTTAKGARKSPRSPRTRCITAELKR